MRGPAFTKRDIPDWLDDEMTPQQRSYYVEMRNHHIQQLRRELSVDGGGWTGLAAGYLKAIANNSPPYGSLHHSLHIIADALAAAASGGDVKQAPGEAPQSGGDSRNAPEQSA